MRSLLAVGEALWLNVSVCAVMDATWDVSIVSFVHVSFSFVFFVVDGMRGVVLQRTAHHSVSGSLTLRAFG